MASTFAPSSLISGCWLPALGILLSGLGVVVLGTGLANSAEVALPAEPSASYPKAGSASQTRIGPAEPDPAGAMRFWSGEGSGAEEIDLARRRTPGPPSTCLVRSQRT
jgi:hypothetical protein